MNLLLWLTILLSTGFWTRFTEVSAVNKWKEQAQRAFQQRKYAQAAQFYQHLLASSTNDQSALQLNLAHSLRLSGKAAASASMYREVSRSTDPYLRSVAWQQLGNLAATAGDYQQALELFKKSLIANSRNETARYNYELVSRLLNKGQKNDTPPPPEPSGEQQSAEEANKGSRQELSQNNTPGEEGQDKDTKQGEEKGNEQGQNSATKDADESNQTPEPGQENASPEAQRMQTLRKRLESLNMTPEQAQTLLDAMHDNELQYLQQLPKPSKNAPRSGKPDW